MNVRYTADKASCSCESCYYMQSSKSITAQEPHYKCKHPLLLTKAEVTTYIWTTFSFFVALRPISAILSRNFPYTYVTCSVSSELVRNKDTHKNLLASMYYTHM